MLGHMLAGCNALRCGDRRFVDVLAVDLVAG